MSEPSPELIEDWRADLTAKQHDAAQADWARDDENDEEEAQ